MEPLGTASILLERHEDEQQVVWASEYSEDGSELLNQTMSELALSSYLVQRNSPARNRTFFACSESWDQVVRSFHFEDILTNCQAPTAAKRDLRSPFPTCFQSYITHGNENSSNSTYHAWMRCNTRWIFSPAELTHLTEPRLSAMRRQLKSDDISITTVSLGLYFCFDSSPGRSTLLTFGLGSLHQHIREQFKNQVVDGGTRRGSVNPLEDPFVLILAWCRGLMGEIEEIAGLWYRRDEIYSENAMQASNHASNIKATEFRHRMAVHTRDWLTSFQDSLVEIRKQHLTFMSDLFTQWNGVQGDAHFVEYVDEQFGRLVVRSKDVERVMRGVVDTTKERLHVLLGYASLRAGIDLKDITRASVEQAAATRSLAHDSKRDGEAMKIITVVTLFYLPATFVTALFGMGIFNWDFENANGRLRLAEDGWLFAAIAVPLTLLTLGLAYGWMWLGDRNGDRAISLLSGYEKYLGRGVELRAMSTLVVPS